jgi:hypothetical protein
VVICNIPKYGILQNIELMAILGIYTMPIVNNCRRG